MIKEYLSMPPVLRESRRGALFKLYIAAEDKVIGVVLAQEGKGKNIYYYIYWVSSS